VSAPISIHDSADAAASPKPRTLWRDARDRIAHSRVAVACLIVACLYLLVGCLGFAPVMERNIQMTVGDIFQPPHFVISQPSVWFGTDIQGRSVFWEVMYGTRLAMTLAIVAATISILIGTTLGILAGYFGGWVDNLVIWLFSTFSSIPWILLAVAIAFVLQSHESLNAWLAGLPTVIIALSLTSWVGLCRLVRGEVLKLRDRDFVAAARAVGAGNTRILVRHIFPNVFHLVIIDFSLGVVNNVQAEVVLAFLGLGITNKPSWGRMIDDSKLDLLRGVWWQLVVATTAIFIFSLVMNILGDALRDALDPRLRGVD
jgi:ABC-type dipeptide/oligopeptide/nickel transport system permease subunit